MKDAPPLGPGCEVWIVGKVRVRVRDMLGQSGEERKLLDEVDGGRRGESRGETRKKMRGRILNRLSFHLDETWDAMETKSYNMQGKRRIDRQGRNASLKVCP
jgi:hypothetical protein